MKEEALDNKHIIEEDSQIPTEKEPVELKKKNPLLFVVPGVIVLLIIGLVGFRMISQKKTTATPVKEEEQIKEDILPLDDSVKVELTKSNVKDNTVIIAISGLASRFFSVGYELQYESGGVGKGVTSGSKPLDVSGQDTFERDIYLGTCSKNVCKPDLGVTKVSLVLEFTSTSNTKYQFSKDFNL